MKPCMSNVQLYRQGRLFSSLWLPGWCSEYSCMSKRIAIKKWDSTLGRLPKCLIFQYYRQYFIVHCFYDKMCYQWVVGQNSQGNRYDARNGFHETVLHASATSVPYAIHKQTMFKNMYQQQRTGHYQNQNADECQYIVQVYQSTKHYWSTVVRVLY